MSKSHIPAVGSRASVWHGNAKHTSGGLTKRDLKMNKHGRIVSRRVSSNAKADKNLGDYLKLARRNKGYEFQPLRKRDLKDL
jgi:hypothetical protein